MWGRINRWRWDKRTCTTVLYQGHFQWASAMFSVFYLRLSHSVAAHIKDKISLHSMSACLCVLSWRRLFSFVDGSANEEGSFFVNYIILMVELSVKTMNK